MNSSPFYYLASFNAHSALILRGMCDEYESVEFSGTLHLLPVDKVDDMIIYHIIMDKYINKGKSESVEVPNNEVTYHTHPKKLYIKYNTKYGFPSIEDYLCFYDGKTEESGNAHI